LNELHLFAGAGGGILGGMLLGHTCVCAVEIEPYRREILFQRQRDGILPKFPIWDDVRTFYGNTWCGKVDVVCGGFPCQDISISGNGSGIKGERSSLWKEMARVICEVRPRNVFVENSPMLVIRGLGTVLRDLAEMGYDAQWGVFSCRDVGGVHLRERIFIHGSNDRKERIQREQPQKVFRFSGFPWGENVGRVEDLRGRSDLPEPLLRRINNGLAFGVDRLAAIGDGQVPSVVKLAWETLSRWV